MIEFLILTEVATIKIYLGSKVDWLSHCAANANFANECCGTWPVDSLVSFNEVTRSSGRNAMETREVRDID